MNICLHNASELKCLHISPNVRDISLNTRIKLGTIGNPGPRGFLGPTARWAHSFVGPKGAGPIGPIQGIHSKKLSALVIFTQHMSFSARNKLSKF